VIDLSQFTGSETFFRHSLMRRIVYTEGVQYLAEAAGAYWLIDKIATSQLEPHIRDEEFQAWKLRVEGTKGVLTAEDGNDGIIHKEKLDFTDFPLPSIDIYFTDNTILLPSEY
jgi:hypothetical protein